MGVLVACKPREDVLKGDLDDAIFAADFGHLIAETAPTVYGDAKTFFHNTHPAKELTRVVRLVFERLADSKEAGAVVRLSTGFGGGKTHTLMALWHLAHNIGDPSLGTELLPAAGRPKKVKVVAVDGSKAGVPEFARHKDCAVHSLWGEIFYRLGGAKAVMALGDADRPEASPSDDQLAAVLPNGPVLFLLDELVIYMAKLSATGQGNLLGFMRSLSSVVVNRKQAVLVVTDPATQQAYAGDAARLGASLAAARMLAEETGRRASDFDPIGTESAQVIVRRLFDTVDRTAAEACSAAYHQLYGRVLEEHPELLPREAGSPDYARRIVSCYPFHPRLMDTAQNRLSVLPDFNKSRGTLRLFARIIRDVWEAKRDLDLVTAGDLNWSSARIQADLLQRLNRDNFRAAVAADVEQHAGALDDGRLDGAHRRVASALLLESLPLEANSGLDDAEVTLAVLRPDEAGTEPSEALHRLVGECWHTYPMAGGRGFQFRYEPNILKQIEERLPSIPHEDAAERLRTEVQGYFQGPIFQLAAWPAQAKQVPERAQLQLALCETEGIAKAVTASADDNDPAAPMPRRYVNAIVAVTATSSAYGPALESTRRLLAAEAIEAEHRHGDVGKLVREQLKRVKPALEKHFGLHARRAFDRVVLAATAAYTIDEQYQSSDEQILQKPRGQESLLRFLEAKQLIYQPADSLDPHRFVRDVLPGTTPIAGEPGVYTTRAVHERFLATPRLRLVRDIAVVRQSILKAVGEGLVAVCMPDGRAFDRDGCTEGLAGSRRRLAGATLTSLGLDDETRIAELDSEAAKAWLKEDPGFRGTEPGVPPPPVPPPTGDTVATSWDLIEELADKRALKQLVLEAKTPAAAAALAGLAQPLGAETLKLGVTASGDLKDGGSANFAAEARLNHPIKPLVMAQTVFNALADGSTYEATLTMTFGPAGRNGLRTALANLRAQAPEGVAVRATFVPTGSGS